MSVCKKPVKLSCTWVQAVKKGLLSFYKFMFKVKVSTFKDDNNNNAS